MRPGLAAPHGVFPARGQGGDPVHLSGRRAPGGPAGRFQRARGHGPGVAGLRQFGGTQRQLGGPALRLVEARVPREVVPRCLQHPVTLVCGVGGQRVGVAIRGDPLVIAHPDRQQVAGEAAQHVVDRPVAVGADDDPLAAARDGPDDFPDHRGLACAGRAEHDQQVGLRQRIVERRELARVISQFPARRLPGS